MNIVLKDVTILHPEQKLNEKTDILLEDGIIKKIGSLSENEIKNSEVYNLEGNYVTPGFFDMHVHLREPGREDKETVITGCNSAAAGGFTGIACMPNTDPTIDTAEVVTSIIIKSKNHLVDVHPIGAVSVGRKGESLAPIAELVEAGAVGFSDDGVAVKSASLLRNAIEYAGMYNAPIIEHCEDPSMDDGAMNESFTSTQLGLPGIPTVAEDLIVMRDILIAEYTGGRVHIAHISSKNSVDLVRQAKAKGIKVTAEVTPHHFLLNDESVKTFDTNYKMNPPLRSKEDVEAMIEGLKDGTIDCIASDHAPHTIEEKEMEFIYAPNGIIGLETQLGISLSELYHKGHLTLEDLVHKLSINPRKILNLEIPKFEIGKEANFSIFNPDTIWTVDVSKFKSKSRNSPFDKKLLTGKPTGVINKKRMFIDDKFINLA